MEKIVLYKYTDPNTEQKLISYDPIPPTRCSIRYYLIADEGKVLVNTKTSVKTRAIIVPEWELNDWVEEDR